jgi:hypothetical protein
VDRLLLSGSTPWTQRVAAVLVWLVGLALAAGLLLFGFFIGAALLGIAAIAGLIAWARIRFGKPILPRQPAASGRPAQRARETIVDAEYVVIRRDDR